MANAACAKFAKRIKPCVTARPADIKNKSTPYATPEKMM
jgi:hypothetical protein